MLTMNFAPAPGEDSTIMVPPWFLVMMKYDTGSPRPVPTPPAFVVKNGSKARRPVSASMPGPLIE